MEVLNYYDLFLTLNGENLEIDPAQTSFMLKYSIFNSIPVSNFIITDPSGLIQEYLLSTPGTPFNIKFGYEETFVEADLFIRNDKLPEAEQPFSVSGDIQIALSHLWLRDQYPRSDAYDGRISEVVRSLSSHKEYKKFTVNVNDTENDNIWYQGNKTDYDFIKDVLLQRALSRNAQGTPFYFFIDEGNTFNFRNYKSLIEEKPVAELVYYQAVENKDPLVPQNNIITTIGKDHKDFFKNKKFYKVTNNILSIEDASVIEEESELSGFYNPNRNQIPIKKLKTKEPTQILWWGKNQNPDDIEGQKRFYFRDSLSQERFMVVVPFNTSLRVGKPVTIKTFTYTKEGDNTSQLSQFSDKYLIEETAHIYDGFSQQALTKCIVSRPNIKLGENYVLKGELL